MANIQDLPNEVLIKILLNALDWTKNAALREREPNIFSQVCRGWRFVLLGMTSELWSYLRYDWMTDGPYPGRVPRYVSIDTMTSLGSYIRRAGGRPLQLDLSLDPEEPPVGISNFFQEFSPTIRSLSLKGSIAVFRAVAMERHINAARFPSLEWLHLDMAYDDSDKDEVRQLAEREIDLVSGCHRLRELTVTSWGNYFGFIKDGVVSGVPWGQLTYLQIRDQSIFLLRVMEIIKQCPQLKMCVLALKLSEGLEPHSNSSSPWIFPSLRVLQLEFIGSTRDRHISQILDVLTLPELEVLHIRAPTCTDTSIIDILSSLQHRSSASIEELYLVDIDLDIERLPSLLLLIPKLKKFRLQAPYGQLYYGYCLLLRMIFCGDGILLPRSVAFTHLETLEICDNFPNTYSISTLEDLAIGVDAFVLGDMNKIFCFLDNGFMEKLTEVNLRWRNIPWNFHHTVEQLGFEHRAQLFEQRGIRVDLQGKP
ncbi:hypothetical protein H0H92_015981 [Tricholoma furcatifolium]|nr:hypothetical protein H0H92_015981 [Tricholoma furcatifolium]